MATKNLARTVIEGGRNYYCSDARRRSHGVARAHSHQLQHALCRGADPEGAVFGDRKPVFRSFYDKLGPARRFLRSQVGRPWNKVRSELFKRFDTRTTAGRHILFDHLLKEVESPPRHFGRRRRLWISAHGILRYTEAPGRRVNGGAK